MIVKSVKSVVLLLALGFSAEQALAKINLNMDAAFGRRWTEAKVSGTPGKTTAYANEYLAGAQYQIMDLPMSAGGSLGIVDYHNDDFNADTAYGIELAATAKAWLPESITQTNLVTPFLKLGYIAYSNYTVESKNDAGVKATVDSSAPGFQVKVGTDIAITEDIGAVVEYAYSNLTEKGTMKSGGRKSDIKKTDITAQAVLIGAQVRI